MHGRITTEWRVPIKKNYISIGIWLSQNKWLIEKKNMGYNLVNMEAYKSNLKQK